MAQLYFKYGAMGSSKTANALMARFNYEERGQKTLLVKPRLDQRDGDHMVHSRIGLEYPCIYFDEMLALSAEGSVPLKRGGGLPCAHCGRFGRAGNLLRTAGGLQGGVVPRQL